MRTPDGTASATPDQAVATLRANCDAATRDNALAVACFSLGQLYDLGQWVPKDGKRAMALHEQSCGLGEMRACTELGAFYADGLVVPRDDVRAAQLYRRACDGGNGRGCNSLLAQHPAKADVEYVIGRYEAICDSGDDPEACMGLAYIYQAGDHRPIDLTRAVALYRRACDASHPMACNNLGALTALGQGTAKDPGVAAALYKKACNLGSRQACVNAGIDPATAAIRIQEH